MFNVYCFEFNSIMRLPIFWFKRCQYLFEDSENLMWKQSLNMWIKPGGGGTHL